MPFREIAHALWAGLEDALSLVWNDPVQWHHVAWTAGGLAAWIVIAVVCGLITILRLSLVGISNPVFLPVCDAPQPRTVSFCLSNAFGNRLVFGTWEL